MGWATPTGGMGATAGVGAATTSTAAVGAGSSRGVEPRCRGVGNLARRHLDPAVKAGHTRNSGVGLRN